MILSAMILALMAVFTVDTIRKSEKQKEGKQE